MNKDNNEDGEKNGWGETGEPYEELTYKIKEEQMQMQAQKRIKNLQKQENKCDENECV